MNRSRIVLLLLLAIGLAALLTFILRTSQDPRLEPLYDLYAERLAYFAANPPAADWDGVFVALTK